MSGVIRFVLCDQPAERSLGRCDAHEHVVMGGSFVATQYPDFDLSDLDASVTELQGFSRAGGGWIVDSMPSGPARQPKGLADVSRRSGVPIVMSTGRHLDCYYPADDPFRAMGQEALTQLFVQEIRQGVDGYRCGVIKVAGSRGGLTDVEREAFIAAAHAQRETGCPILTHTEADAAGAWDQVRTLEQHGAVLEHVILSHLDKNPDQGLHTEILATGVRVEYDQHFRRLGQDQPGVQGPFDFMAAAVANNPGSILLGMDLARRSYWAARGGSPGLSWLLTGLVDGLKRAGLNPQQIDRCLIDNAIDTLTMQPQHQPTLD